MDETSFPARPSLRLIQSVPGKKEAELIFTALAELSPRQITTYKKGREKAKIVSPLN